MANITAINFKLTEGIESHVNNRMSKFDKFIKKEDNNINVILESNKYGKKAEASFKLYNKSLRASVVNDDLYIAVDLLVDKLSRVIEKNLGKLNEINKYETIKHMEYYNKNKIKSNEKDESPRIVRRKVVSSKPMFEEEAMEQMELLDHKSFIFHNASTDKISMLYKRLDGDYGILETD